jgi:hypothetical protein
MGERTFVDPKHVDPSEYRTADLNVIGTGEGGDPDSSTYHGKPVTGYLPEPDASTDPLTAAVVKLRRASEGVDWFNHD